MRKLNLWLVAVLGMCSAVVTSCSNDVVSNEVDGGVLETKANPGAYQVKSVTLTVGQNATPNTITYNADGKVNTVTTEQYGYTRVATYDYSTAGKVIVSVNDEGNDHKTYTYDLNAAGYAINAAGVYDDGYVEDDLVFTYNANGRLESIIMDDVEMYSFTYVSNKVNDFTTISEQGAAAKCILYNVINRASFDLNLYSIVAAGQELGDAFAYAVFGDLFPNTVSLVSRLQLNPTTYIDYTYTMVAGTTDKPAACAITSTWSETDEDTGETGQFSSTFDVTFGY